MHTQRPLLLVTAMQHAAHTSFAPCNQLIWFEEPYTDPYRSGAVAPHNSGGRRVLVIQAVVALFTIAVASVVK